NMTGGTLEGIPVITTQYAANSSGGGNLVIAVHAPSILLADDGNVTVDASDQVSLEMKDVPTINSVTGTGASLVSMWQTNSLAVRAEREITWLKGRSEAVVYMDDVNWGSVGSPAQVIPSGRVSEIPAPAAVSRSVYGTSRRHGYFHHC